MRHYLTLLLLSIGTSLLSAQDPLSDLYYEGAYNEVVELSSQAIQDGDSNINIWLLKALSLEQLGSIPEAIRTLEQALGLHEEESRFIRMLGRQYARAGDYVRAAKQYEILVAADSNDVSSWLELAEIASFRQENEACIAALEEVLRIDSINLEGLMLMGEILDRHNNTGALVYYRRANRIYPENQKVAHALSNWYIKARQAHRAIPICTTILSSDTSNIRFNKLLGYAYYKTGEPFKANIYFEDATRLGDSTAFTFKFMGISRYLSVDFTGGAEALRQSVEKDSLDAEVHFFLGACLATTKEKKAAMAHLDRSLELMLPDPKISSRIYAEKANILRLEERYQDSYDLYALSLEADSTNLMSLYLMASLQDNSLDNDALALADYERFIAMLDRQPAQDEKKNMPSIRSIVEDRIISLREEMFFRDED